MERERFWRATKLPFELLHQLPQCSGRPRFLATFPRIFAGTHTSAKDIEQTRCRTIDLELDGPVDCMVDGEILKVRLRRLELMSHALEVML